MMVPWAKFSCCVISCRPKETRLTTLHRWSTRYLDTLLFGQPGIYGKLAVRYIVFTVTSTPSLEGLIHSRCNNSRWGYSELMVIQRPPLNILSTAFLEKMYSLTHAYICMNAPGMQRCMPRRSPNLATGPNAFRPREKNGKRSSSSKSFSTRVLGWASSKRLWSIARRSLKAKGS